MGSLLFVFFKPVINKMVDYVCYRSTFSGASSLESQVLFLIKIDVYTLSFSSHNWRGDNVFKISVFTKSHFFVTAAMSLFKRHVTLHEVISLSI